MAEAPVKSKVGLAKKFGDLTADTKTYLSGLESLLDDPKKYGVALAFLFMKVEEGQHRALKCGLIRKHKCNSQKVDDALAKQHFTRAYFKIIFKNVFGAEVAKEALASIENAEKVRDQLIHGKKPAQKILRDAISGAFDYIIALGQQVEGKTDKNPFGDLRGLAGKAALMDETTTFWVLKGMGFYNEKGSSTP